jgi:Viral BACON domain
MRRCIYCGAELQSQAGFCRYCGQLSQPIKNQSESNANDGNQALQANALDAATTVSTSHWEYSAQNQSAQYSAQAPTGFGMQPPVDDEEEERRRKAALFGLGVVGIAGIAGEVQPPISNVPMAQGTPQINGVPMVHGTPPLAGSLHAQNVAQSSYSPGYYASQTQQLSHAPQPTAPPTLHPHPTSPPGPHPTSPHQPTAGGCAPVWLIFVFVAILIITSIISIGLTVLSPGLALLSGSGDVTLGGTLQLHGTSFIPGSSVSFTLDGATPLYFTNQGSNSQALHSSNILPSLEIFSIHGGQLPAANNAVKAGIDGTFTVTILVDQSWKTGQHTIRASERFTPRSASITFTVRQAGDTPTPTSASPTATSTLSPTASPSVTPSATTTPGTLSCLNPASVTIGPVSEGYNQAISTQVNLCATGSGLVNWTATWDQNQAPWVKLDHNSGQIQAPGQQQITVSALATNLKAGNYNATITFSNQQGSPTETLNVSFAVQTGCIRTNQQAFRFSGIAGGSDPQPQTVVVSNCGTVGTWSSSSSTNNNVKWLSVAPTGGGLNGGATQNVTINVSVIKTQLGAGTYSGQILFAIGSSQASVSVTLVVMAAPKIVVVVPNPPCFKTSTQCTQCTLNVDLKVWTCVASISNSSQSLSLNWRTASSGVPNITFKPSTGTLPANVGVRVTITVPENNCQTPTTLEFIGPYNTANVSWSC